MAENLYQGHFTNYVEKKVEGGARKKMTILLNKCYQVKLSTRWCQHGKEIVNVICERPLTMFVCTHFGEKNWYLQALLGVVHKLRWQQEGRGGVKKGRNSVNVKVIYVNQGGGGVKTDPKFVNVVCEQPHRHWY